MTTVSPSFIDEVVALYLSGLSRDAVADRLQSNHTLVRKILESKGVMRDRKKAALMACTKYAVNDRFFETIDTLEKCWALGWFFTDGYNRVSPADARISLNERDEEVLVKLNKLFGNDKPLTREPKYHRITLVVSREQFSHDLNRHGCVQAKSLIVQYPHHLLDTREKTCAFLRGVLEGDGCIHVDTATKYGYVVVTICSGSPSFVDSIGKVFNECWGLEGHIMKQKGSIVGIRFRKDPVKLLALLDDIYDTKLFGLYLNRKYEKYLSVRQILLDQISERELRRSRKVPIDLGVYVSESPSF